MVKNIVDIRLEQFLSVWHHSKYPISAIAIFGLILSRWPWTLIRSFDFRYILQPQLIAMQLKVWWKYRGYQIRAISKCITPLKIPYIDLRYFWPDFISLTLNFYEVIWFQKHSLAAADCYTAVSSSEKYREFEIGAIS